MKHRCPESGCLYCMVTDLYKIINGLKEINSKLAHQNMEMKRRIISAGSSGVERGPEEPGVGGANPSQRNASLG